MVTRFISDLHLSESRPDITALFIRFLRTDARKCDALYILGDLFDYWIGDDDQSQFHTEVESEIAAVADSGVPVYFIAGNRDFLIGKRFSQRTGIKILPEPSTINLYGRNTLIMHGDTLCTEDTKYQRYRRVIRNPILLSLLTSLPLTWRRRIAEKLRAGSASNKPATAQSLQIMDATEEGVVRAMEQVPSDLLIHGHTHRPAVHEHDINGKKVTRIVLGDWFEQGSILNVSAGGYELTVQPLPGSEKEPESGASQHNQATGPL